MNDDTLTYLFFNEYLNIENNLYNKTEFKREKFCPMCSGTHEGSFCQANEDFLNEVA